MRSREARPGHCPRNLRRHWQSPGLAASDCCVARADVFACSQPCRNCEDGDRSGQRTPHGLPALRSDSAGRQAVLRGLRGAVAVALRGLRRCQPDRQPLLRRLRRRGRLQHHSDTGRAAAAAGPRTPPAHRHVLRPGRFDGARCPPRPGGSARGHRRLPSLHHRRGHPRRRLRCPLHGRRRAGLFRISKGARDRRGTCGARRPGGGGGDQPACDHGWPGREHW